MLHPKYRLLEAGKLFHDMHHLADTVFLLQHDIRITVCRKHRRAGQLVRSVLERPETVQAKMFRDLYGKCLHAVVAFQFIADIPHLQENLLYDILHILRVIQQAAGTSRQLSPERYDFYFKLFLFHSI